MIEKLEQTYRDERGGLLAFIRSKIGDAEEAEDILQDVFIQATRSLNLTTPIENLIAWLYRVAKNRIIDWYRKKRYRTVSIQSTNHGTDERATIEEMLAGSGIDIEKDLIRSLVTEAVIESVEELPEAQREVFILQAIEGKTFREISESTGMSINTLLARKRYAVQFLRKRLRDLKEMLQDV
ncbi:MAG TPA: sigma-70 family RNA polymerase sigma factor [Spirochaetia bacterium]|nr:sigma-70 family RNA polymerase sigma factor [Spirochaetia bacterium]